MNFTDLVTGLKTEARLIRIYNSTGREEQFLTALNRLLEAIDELPLCQHKEFADGHCAEMSCPNYYSKRMVKD